MTTHLDEALIEINTVDCFRELVYDYVHGPKTTPTKGAVQKRVIYGCVLHLFPSVA